MEATSLPRPRAPMLPRRLLVALDDERLVEHLRRGNEMAFEVVYDRHHRGILAYARHLLGSLEEAEDAVQHTFAAAHSALIAEYRDIRLKPWLYAIARNRCLSILRARREQPAELDEISTAGLSEEVQQRDDLRALLADLRELPEPQRAALVLAEVADLAHAEIAHVLGCDVSKVKSLVFQARSGLIERRQSRETPCEEIREQLSVLRGGSLRRGPLRRHLKACPGCASYREEVRRQRQMLAVALPVIPTIGLKQSVLAAAGLGGAATGGGAAAAAGGAGAGAAGLAASGGAASGGLAAAAAAVSAKAGVAKVAAAVVAGAAALGGGTVAVTGDHTPAQPLPAEAPEGVPASGAPGPLGGAPAVAPAGTEERGEDARRRGSRRPARPGSGARGGQPAGERNRRAGRRRAAPERARGRGAPRTGDQGDRNRGRDSRPGPGRRRDQAVPRRQAPRRATPQPRTQTPAQPPAQPAPEPEADPIPMAAPETGRRAPAQSQLTAPEE